MWVWPALLRGMLFKRKLMGLSVCRLWMCCPLNWTIFFWRQKIWIFSPSSPKYFFLSFYSIASCCLSCQTIYVSLIIYARAFSKTSECCNAITFLVIHTDFSQPVCTAGVPCFKSSKSTAIARFIYLGKWHVCTQKN